MIMLPFPAVDLLRANSGSLQLLPIIESAVRPPPPTIHCTTPDKEVVEPLIGGLTSIEPLIEVSEEEEDSNKLAAATNNKGPNKEEKENQNYEKKLQSLSRYVIILRFQF
jgi:hypothetical protein